MISLRKLLGGAILKARTPDTKLAAVDDALGVFDDREIEDLLDERERIDASKLPRIERLCRRHAHPGCNTGAHELALAIIRICEE